MKKPYYNEEQRELLKENKTLTAAKMNLVLAFRQFQVEFTSSFPGSLFKRKKVAKVFCKKKKNESNASCVEKSEVYVTMDWAGNPITTKGDGYILPRKAEMILNKQYYPNGIVGEWPCDPITGKKLPIEPRK